MRGLLVFVVLCLVSAIRPMPPVAHEDPYAAKLDGAQPVGEHLACRGFGDPVDRVRRGADAMALVVAPWTLTAPARRLIAIAHPLRSAPVLPETTTRLARGPPVG